MQLLSISAVKLKSFRLLGIYMNFSGYQFPSAIILQAVRYYISYKLSYREIEEILAERGILVDHSTLNRWVIRLGLLQIILVDKSDYLQQPPLYR